MKLLRLLLLFVMPAVYWPWVTTVAYAAPTIENVLEPDLPLSDATKERLLEGIQRHTLSLEGELTATKQANGQLSLGLSAVSIHSDTLLSQLSKEHAEHTLAEAARAVVQEKLDVRTQERDDARRERDEERHMKRVWFWTWIGTVALVAGFFIARQYFPILKAI